MLLKSFLVLVIGVIWFYITYRMAEGFNFKISTNNVGNIGAFLFSIILIIGGIIGILVALIF
jgi:hypothetical protein